MMRLSAATFAVFFVLVSLTGCGPVKEGDQILADAIQASNTLQTYYNDLAQISLDGWENQAVFNALLTVPAPSDQQYNERLEALRTRADAASKLSLTFQSLKTFRDPKGLTSASAAGQSLGESLKGISKIPGASKLPEDEFGKAAAGLLDIQRQQDLKRALLAMTQVEQGFLNMFEAEQRAYLSIVSDRADTGEHLVELLAQNKMLNPGSFLAGLRLGVAVTPATSDPAAAAGLAIAKISAQRQKLEWECATENTRSMLSALAAAGAAIQSGAAPNLIPLEDSTAHATACLTEHEKLVAPPASGNSNANKQPNDK